MYTCTYIHAYNFIMSHQHDKREGVVQCQKDKKRRTTFIMSRNSLCPNSPCSLRCLPCHNTPSFHVLHIMCPLEHQVPLTNWFKFVIECVLCRAWASAWPMVLACDICKRFRQRL